MWIHVLQETHEIKDVTNIGEGEKSKIANIKIEKMAPVVRE